MASRRTVPRRLLGKVLVAGGAVALLASLAGTVVAFVIAGDIHRASRNGLAVTEEALTSVRGTIGLTGRVLGTVRGAMDTVVSTIDSVATTVANAQATLGQVSAVVHALPDTLDGAVSSLSALSGVADSIDHTLGALAVAPFIPGYAPAVSFGDTLRNLQSSLEPLPARVRTLASQLDTSVAQGQTLSATLQHLNQNVSDVDARLAEAAAQVDTFAATTEQAQRVAVVTRDELDRDLLLTRLVIVPLGLGLAVSQLVPLFMGWLLLQPQREAGLGLSESAPAETAET